jgi:hypothetical protein
VGVNIPTSSEYEADANRLRAQIGVTIAELRSSLTPSNIASEAASRAGIADLSWGGAFEYASKRHPVPTAIIGIGIALLAMSAVRRRARDGGVVALTAPLSESSASIVDSATRVFRARAEAKRREFVDVARAQVATGAATLSDEIEKQLGNIVDRAPGGAKVRPLIESAIQVALAAALEGLLRRHSRL